MHPHLRKRHLYAASTDLSVTGAKLTFAPAVTVDVYRAGFLLTADLTAGSFAFTLNRGPVDGAAPVEEAEFVADTDRSENDMVYADVIVPIPQADGDDTLSPGGETPQTSKVDVAPFGPMRVFPGESVVFEVEVGATSGNGVPFLEIVEHDLTGYDRDNIFKVN